jgi:hypothetical protein
MRHLIQRLLMEAALLLLNLVAGSMDRLLLLLLLLYICSVRLCKACGCILATAAWDGLSSLC